MRRRRTPWRHVPIVAAVAALGLAAVGVGVGGAAPAIARADAEIGLSLDGTEWGGSLRAPLFDPAVHRVPGERETQSFYLRNDGPTAADLTIAVHSSGGDEPLVDDVEIAARLAGRGWRPLVNGGRSASLTRQAIDAGGVVRVDVDVRFRSTSGNATQRQQLPLELSVGLSQAARRGGGEGGDDGGVLPEAGSALTRGLLWLGALLLGTGLAVLTARRRERAAVVRDG